MPRMYGRKSDSRNSQTTDKFIWRSAMTPPLNPINRKAQSAPVITRNLRYLTTNATVVLQPAFRDPDEIFDQYVDQIHKRLAQSKQAKPAKNSKEEVKTMEVESESTFQKAGVPVATVDESIDELEHQAETVVEDGLVEDTKEPQETITISQEFVVQPIMADCEPAIHQETADEIENIDVAMDVAIDDGSAPFKNQPQNDIPTQESFDSQDFPTVTLLNNDENLEVGTAKSLARTPTPRPPIFNEYEIEGIAPVSVSRLERSDTGRSSRQSARSFRTVVENPDFVQKDEAEETLLNVYDQIEMESEANKLEMVEDSIKEDLVEAEIAKPRSRPASSKSIKSRKSSAKSVKNSARSVKSEKTEGAIQDEGIEEKEEIAETNMLEDAEKVQALLQAQLIEVVESDNMKEALFDDIKSDIRPGSGKSGMSNRSKRSKPSSAKLVTDIQATEPGQEKTRGSARQSRQGSAPVVLPSQLSQDKNAEENADGFCWACKLDVEGDDEWKLLNEELHEKRPHYLIHTCGMKDRKIQSPIEKDLKQIPAEDMVLAEQSIGSAEDDYRKVDEWAILQEEIHDPEHFAVPERVGTPQSGKSKRSVSRIEVVQIAAPQPIVAVETANLTPMSTLDEVIAAAKRKSICSSASSPLPPLPKPTNDVLRTDEEDEENLDDDSLTDELETTKTATVERLYSAKSHNKIEPTAGETLAKKMVDSDEEDFHLTGVPPKNLSLEEEDAIAAKEEPTKRLETIVSAESSSSVTKEEGSDDTGIKEKVEITEKKNTTEKEVEPKQSLLVEETESGNKEAHAKDKAETIEEADVQVEPNCPKMVAEMQEKNATVTEVSHINAQDKLSIDNIESEEKLEQIQQEQLEEIQQEQQEDIQQEQLEEIQQEQQEEIQQEQLEEIQQEQQEEIQQEQQEEIQQEQLEEIQQEQLEEIQQEQQEQIQQEPLDEIQQEQADEVKLEIQAKSIQEQNDFKANEEGEEPNGIEIEPKQNEDSTNETEKEEFKDLKQDEKGDVVNVAKDKPEKQEDNEEAKPIRAEKTNLHKFSSLMSSSDGYDLVQHNLEGMGTSFNSLSPEPVKAKVGALQQPSFIGSLDGDMNESTGDRDSGIEPQIAEEKKEIDEKKPEPPDVPAKNMRNSVIRPPSKRTATRGRPESAA